MVVGNVGCHGTKTKTKRRRHACSCPHSGTLLGTRPFNPRRTRARTPFPRLSNIFLLRDALALMTRAKSDRAPLPSFNNLQHAQLSTSPRPRDGFCRGNPSSRTMVKTYGQLENLFQGRCRVESVVQERLGTHAFRFDARRLGQGEEHSLAASVE